MLKLLKAEHPDPADLARLQHECAIAADLPGDGFVRPLRVQTFGRHTGLVSEDTGGTSLAAVIGPDGMEVGTALHLASSLVRAVGTLHEADVIHRDIKPANVVVDPDLREARLIDFGVATRAGSWPVWRTRSARRSASP